MNQTSRIYVAGHSGLVGSALVRALNDSGHEQLITRTHAKLDLCDASATLAFFKQERPEYVFLAAAKVGGIKANDTHPADFIRVNLQIQTNVIDAAQRTSCRKLLFLGSSCIYPKHAPQPMREEHLLTGPLEPTNDAYAIAKIAGILMCKSYNRQHGTNFVAAMPTNLYGPGDNFDLDSSHVLPALLRKFHQAKLAGHAPVELWGTGSPRREFLHVDDMAAGCLHLMRHFDYDPARPDAVFINLGSGQDLEIRELALLVQRIVGHEGELVWNSAMPDGTPRKLLDVSAAAALGWRAKLELEEGIRRTYAWFLEHAA